MLQNLKKLAVLGAVLSFVFLPLMASAQVTSPFDPGEVRITDENAIINLMFKLLVFLRTIFWILAVGFILYAAFLYLTSGGGDGVGKATDMLKYAVIAIVVALIATSLPFLVRNILD